MTYPPRGLSYLSLYQRLVFYWLNFWFGESTQSGFYQITLTRNLYLSLHSYSKPHYADFMDGYNHAYLPAMVSYDKYLRRRDLLRQRAVRFLCYLVIFLILARCMSLPVCLTD